MPVADPVDRNTAMRSAALASVGVALWLGATFVLNLILSVTDDGMFGDPPRWAFAVRWLVSNGGALLLLIGAHGLAKEIRAAVQRCHTTSAAADGKHQTRRSPALVLLAVGLALNAYTESQVFVIDVGDILPPVYGFTTLVSAYAGPVALTSGIYLALRRLAALMCNHFGGHGELCHEADDLVDVPVA